MAEQLYYVVDLRPEWRNQQYITLWRPQNSNYAWPLAWAGKYRIDELKPGYHQVRRGRIYERFAVACEVVDSLGGFSDPGDIDGGQMMVVWNTKHNRRTLQSKRFNFERSKVAANKQPR